MKKKAEFIKPSFFILHKQKTYQNQNDHDDGNDCHSFQFIAVR